MKSAGPYCKTLATPETTKYEFEFLNDQFVVDAKGKKVCISLKTIKGITVGCWDGDLSTLLINEKALQIANLLMRQNASALLI
jgi:hypothetical protein